MKDIQAHIQILERLRFAELDLEEQHDPRLYIRALDDWNVWRDLMLFAKRTNMKLKDFIVDLRFSELDEAPAAPAVPPPPPAE